jgi:hypothetical protein
MRVNEEAFNLGVRKLLKTFGVTAQREIEKAVDQGLRGGALSGIEKLKARAVLTVEGLPLRVEVEGEIPLA